MNNLGFEKNKEVFKVPDNYFQELEASILAKTIDTEKQLKPLRNKRFILFSSITGIAASLLLIAIFYTNFNKATLSETDIVSVENSIYSTLLDDSTLVDAELFSYESDYEF